MPVDPSLLFAGRVKPEYFQAPAAPESGNSLSTILALAKMQNDAKNRQSLEQIAGMQDPAQRAAGYRATGSYEGIKLAEDLGKQQYQREKDVRDEAFRGQGRSEDLRHTGVQEGLATAAEGRASQESAMKQQEAILEKAQNTVAYLKRYPTPENLAKGIDYLDSASKGVVGYDPGIAAAYRQRLSANPSDAPNIISEYEGKIMGAGGAPKPPAESTAAQTVSEAKGLEAGIGLEAASRGISDVDIAKYNPLIVNEVAANPNPGVIGRAWNAAVGTAISDEARRVARYETAFAQTYGTHDTGATISPQQNFAYRQRFFPQPGDRPEDIAAKQKDREETALLVLGSSQPAARTSMYQLLGRADPMAKQPAAVASADPMAKQTAAVATPATPPTAAAMPGPVFGRSQITALATKRGVSPESIADAIRTKGGRIEGE